MDVTTIIILAASNLILGLMVWVLGWAWMVQAQRCRRLLDMEAERRQRQAELRPLQ
jgi:hypothetical protein